MVVAFAWLCQLTFVQTRLMLAPYTLSRSWLELCPAILYTHLCKLWQVSDSKDHSNVGWAVGPAASDARQLEEAYVHGSCGNDAMSNTSAAATAVSACKATVDPHAEE